MTLYLITHTHTFMQKQSFLLFNKLWARVNNLCAIHHENQLQCNIQSHYAIISFVEALNQVKSKRLNCITTFNTIQYIFNYLNSINFIFNTIQYIFNYLNSIDLNIFQTHLRISTRILSTSSKWSFHLRSSIQTLQSIRALQHLTFYHDFLFYAITLKSIILSFFQKTFKHYTTLMKRRKICMKKKQSNALDLLKSKKSKRIES